MGQRGGDARARSAALLQAFEVGHARVAFSAVYAQHLRRYSGDELVRVRIDGGVEFAVDYSRWNHHPEQRRSILAAERDEQPQPW